MLAEVNTAHTTGADMAQEFVLTQEESFVFALEDFLRLPAGQETGIFKGLADGDGVFEDRRIGRFRQGFFSRSESLWIDEFALFDQIENFVGGDLRHTANSQEPIQRSYTEPLSKAPSVLEFPLASAMDRGKSPNFVYF